MNETMKMLIGANRRYEAEGRFAGDVSPFRRAVSALRSFFAVDGVTVAGAIYDILSGKVEFVDSGCNENEHEH